MKSNFDNTEKVLKFLDELYKKGKQLTDEVVEEIRKYIGNTLDKTAIYNMAKNYQIKTVNIYSLEDVIEWFKNNDVPRTKKGVYKLGKREDGRHVIYLFFIDTDGAVLDGQLPVCVVYTLKLDEDLKEFFNRNEFFVLNM